MNTDTLGSEVTGLNQCITYAQHLAQQASTHGPAGNEGYLARLVAAQVTGAGLTTGHDMQTAFATAATAATAHATELGKQTTVQEQYNANPDAGDKTFQTSDTGGGTGSPTTRSNDARTAMTDPSDTPSPSAGNAGDEDELPDPAGLTDTGAQHWRDCDVVVGADGQVFLGRYQDPDTSDYVVVATKPAGQRWEPNSNNNGSDPTLNAAEAAQFADVLDELVALGRSGTATRTPTKLDKVAERVRELLGTSGVKIIGDEGEIELSAADIRKLLDAAAPEPAVATRRKVAAKACEKESMDTGAVWAQLDTSGAEPVIAITATEGEAPEEYPEGYTTTRLPLDTASQLAAKVRRFAETTPQVTTETAGSRRTTSRPCSRA